ncbi:hypothetical protein Tco_0718825 [Tanacetum coccineum]
MLSKPVKKTTHVSLAPGFIPGPSSDVRGMARRTTVCFCQTAPPRDRQDPSNLGLLCMRAVLAKERWCVFLPVSFSLLLLFGYLPFESFTMSLEDSDDLNISDAAPVNPVLEAIAFPKELHRGSYRRFLQAMQTRQLVLIPEQGREEFVADPFPKPSEYNASDVTKLREVVISLRRPPLSILYVAGLSNVWKHAGRAFSIKDLEVLASPQLQRLLGCCRDPASTRCRQGDPPGPSPAARLEDIPPKTGDMIVAEMPYRKVVDDKERKKRKAEEKAATKAPTDDIQVEEVVAKAAGREGPRKKRRVHVGAQAPPDSEHVSSPTPLNQAKSLEALANEEHVSPLLSVGRMGNADASPALEGHGDNEDGLSGPQIRPSSVRPFGCHHDILEEPAPEKFVSDAEATLKEQHADLVYAHESCADVKVRFKEYRKELEELKEEKKDADNLNSSQTDRIRQLEEAFKQAEADAGQLRSKKVHYAVEAGKGEIVRQKIVNQYLPTFVRRLHQSTEYKRSLGQVFSLAVGKGFIEGVYIGRKEEDVQAILKATPNVDPASSETFLPVYEKLFDQRYPYVDKVARMYLLDPTELQNIMPDETGPTSGGGPRNTPTPSYA